MDYKKILNRVFEDIYIRRFYNENSELSDDSILNSILPYVDYDVRMEYDSTICPKCNSEMIQILGNIDNTKKRYQCLECEHVFEITQQPTYKVKASMTDPITHEKIIFDYSRLEEIDSMPINYEGIHKFLEDTKIFYEGEEF